MLIFFITRFCYIVKVIARWFDLWRSCISECSMQTLAICSYFAYRCLLDITKHSRVAERSPFARMLQRHNSLIKYKTPIRKNEELSRYRARALSHMTDPVLQTKTTQGVEAVFCFKKSSHSRQLQNDRDIQHKYKGLQSLPIINKFMRLLHVSRRQFILWPVQIWEDASINIDYLFLYSQHPILARISCVSCSLCRKYSGLHNYEWFRLVMSA